MHILFGILDIYNKVFILSIFIDCLKDTSETEGASLPPCGQNMLLPSVQTQTVNTTDEQICVFLTASYIDSNMRG